MKKLIFSTMILAITSTVMAQSPQSPDKSPPIAVASPQYAPRVVAAQQTEVIAVAQPMVRYVQVAQPVAYQQVAVGYQQSFAVASNHCVNNNLGFNRFGVGGGNVNISAVDRRGTVVNASGNNRVRINRGLFGNIRSARAF